VLRSGKRR